MLWHLAVHCSMFSVQEIVEELYTEPRTPNTEHYDYHGPSSDRRADPRHPARGRPGAERPPGRLGDGVRRGLPRGHAAAGPMSPVVAAGFAVRGDSARRVGAEPAGDMGGAGLPRARGVGRPGATP